MPDDSLDLRLLQHDLTEEHGVGAVIVTERGVLLQGLLLMSAVYELIVSVAKRKPLCCAMACPAPPARHQTTPAIMHAHWQSLQG